MRGAKPGIGSELKGTTCRVMRFEDAEVDYKFSSIRTGVLRAWWSALKQTLGELQELEFWI